MPVADRPSQTTQELIERAVALGLERVATEIAAYAEPAVRLVPGGTADPSFFGAPLALPPGIQPPRHGDVELCCIACIELSQIAGIAQAYGAPAQGWLSFYIVLGDALAQGEGLPFNGGTARVLHLPPGPLRPAPGGYGEFRQIAFEPMVTIPEPGTAQIYWSLTAAEMDAYYDLQGPQAGAGPGPQSPPFAMHYMFGRPASLTSGGPEPRSMNTTLLLQLELYEATGADVLGRPRLLFEAERDHPLNTLEVVVQA